LPRSSVFLGKLAAAIGIAAFVLSVSALAAWAVRGGRFGTGPSEAIPASLPQALACCGLLAIGTAAYSSIFAAIGTVFRRPLLIGVLVAFGWEVIVSNVPGVIPSVTVMYYLRSLFVAAFGPLPIPVPNEGLFENVAFFVPARDALLVLGAITAVAAALGAAAVSRREYVLNRSE
jgi:hypothetical protein